VALYYYNKYNAKREYVKTTTELKKAFAAQPYESFCSTRTWYFQDMTFTPEKGYVGGRPTEYGYGSGQWVNPGLWYNEGTVAVQLRSEKWKDPTSFKEYLYVDYYRAELKDLRGTLVDSNLIAEDGKYPVNGKHTDGFWYVKGIAVNKEPIVALTTGDNRTLYEGDTFAIEGSATDADNGNIVNVRYQINAGTIRALQTGISDGKTPIAFNKALTFKGGILYDGATAITTALAEGVVHTLKVWAEDDQGGKSTTIAERTFYVVPNRPPALTIDPIAEQSSLINVDAITIKGTSSDPDGNDVKVSYKLNNGLATEVHSGQGAPFTFDLKLADLKVGENLVVVEVIDSYNFKTSKTIKLNKTENLTPLLKSTQRYGITPPSGSVKGVLLWIQRDKNLAVSASSSMTLTGEQEVYKPMTKTTTAPVTDSIDEDEYILESVDPKQKIILKLELNRPGVDVNPAISLISGVLS